MGEVNVEGELYVRARKVFVEKPIVENTEKCPECEAHGKASSLQYFYISLEEAIYKCSNTQCLYPFENFYFKDLKDNSVYYYEEVGDKDENVFFKVLPNGKKDESQKALWGPRLDKTTDDCDIESYNEDLDTFFENLFAENPDPIPTNPTSGQLALESPYPPSFIEQNVVETTQQTQSTSENYEPLPDNFFDFLDEPMPSTSKADSEAKSTPNDIQMDAVDDLLNMLGGNDGSNHTAKQPVHNPVYNPPAKKSSNIISRTLEVHVARTTKQTPSKNTNSKPQPEPKLTKCIKLIEKSKNKRSRKSTPKSLDIAQQVPSPKPIKYEVKKQSNFKNACKSEDKSKIVNSWHQTGVTRPCDLAQQIIAGNFWNPQLISNLKASNNKACSPNKSLEMIKRTPMMAKPSTVVSGQYLRQTQTINTVKPEKSWDLMINPLLSLPQANFPALNKKQIDACTPDIAGPVLRAEMPIISADMPTVLTDVSIVPADMSTVLADMQIVPSEIPIVPGNMPIVPAETPIVPTKKPVSSVSRSRGKTKKSEESGSRSQKRKSNADNLNGLPTEDKPIKKKPRANSTKSKKVENAVTSLVKVKNEQQNCEDILSTIKGDHTYQIDLDDIHVSNAESEPLQSTSSVKPSKPRKRKLKCEESSSSVNVVDSSKSTKKSQSNTRKKTKKAEETEGSETAQNEDKPTTIKQENECTTVKPAGNSVKVEQDNSSKKVKRSTRPRKIAKEKNPTIKSETTKKSRASKKSGTNKEKEPSKKKTNSKVKSSTNPEAAADFCLIGNDCNSGIDVIRPNVSGIGDDGTTELKGEENSFDSSISSEGIPLDGFTQADIDRASTGSDFGKLADFLQHKQNESNFLDTSSVYVMPTTDSTMQTTERMANISPIKAIDTDSFQSKQQKHKQVDISGCYKFKNFGRKVEPKYKAKDIMSDWNDMEDESTVHSQAVNQMEIDGDYDNIDGISLSSASSIGTMNQRLSEFNSDLPPSDENYQVKR